MSFTPQNFQDFLPPAVSAAWLNGVDQLVYNVFGGTQTGQGVVLPTPGAGQVGLTVNGALDGTFAQIVQSKANQTVLAVENSNNNLSSFAEVLVFGGSPNDNLVMAMTNAAWAANGFGIQNLPAGRVGIIGAMSGTGGLGPFPLCICNAAGVIMEFTADGRTIIPAVAAGITLTVNGVIPADDSGRGFQVQVVNGDARMGALTSGSSAGNAMANFDTPTQAWSVGNRTGSFVIAANASLSRPFVTITPQGLTTFTGPTSGICVAINQAPTASEALLVQGNQGSGISNGVLIIAGTTAADYALNVENAVQGSLFKVDGAGDVAFNSIGVTTGAPTGGAAGALPAAPVGYVTFTVNGVARKVPFYT